MSDPVRYFYRGQVHSVSDAEPTRTVLQQVREQHHCTGSKEGCAEGDCGACTVVIGELKGERVVMKAVNACIQFLPTLDGKALFTVEDLKQADGALHPVQQAMVECHGSQCGFCTPGFVMSLWALYLKQQGKKSSREEINEALSGNLCRCTGYRSIIDAAQRMQELPAQSFDETALADTLRNIQREECFSYAHNGRTFHTPRMLEHLIALRAQLPQATLLSGSTDVGLWVNKQMRDLGDIIYLNQVTELQQISEADGMIEIGAAVTLDDAYAALTRHYPQLRELWQRFASLPIRNTGTLVGNLANGSPIGDSAPWLIAAGSEIVLRSVAGRRVLALEDFYLDYQKKDMQPQEFVEAVRVPLPAADVQLRSYKLAKRFDQDISAVCAAFAVKLDGRTVREARIAFGGVAATSRRAPKAEAALTGHEWNETTLNAAMTALEKDYAPLTDMRASSGYRLKAAQNLLRRFWLETRPDAPLPVASLNAFASGEQG
ncbi:MAG TPA: xanthine dehydrogenase small subunit [Noviherbaspirillum sp.]